MVTGQLAQAPRSGLSVSKLAATKIRKCKSAATVCVESTLWMQQQQSSCWEKFGNVYQQQQQQNGCSSKVRKREK